MLDLGDRVKKNISPCTGNFLGHVHLEISNETELCMKLARDSYALPGGQVMGAIGIEAEVRGHLEVLVHERWVGVDEPSLESTNEGPFMRLSVGLQKLCDHGEEIEVINDGEIQPPRKLPV